ncbi:sulfatase-like hydrolase/transferase [candidate division KSB1 bacterium]|nr:sulfatase-like hydrolase/transferase [candidate division KSB1 bacterium]
MTGLAALGLPLLTSCKKSKPNILFIVVDDLRPELGCFGEEHIISPNIDRLAAQGVRFERSHCNVPVCGASRASLLTGVRPTWDRFVTYYTRADEDLPGHLSLPRYLKQNGYITRSRSKVYHHKDDDLHGWSEPPWAPEGDWVGWQAYITDESKRMMQQNEHSDSDNPNRVIGPAWEIADVEDNAYPDGMTADKAVEDLRALAHKKQPFFLAVGFLKPHLPFNAPKKYFDLYDHDKIELAPNPYVPENAPLKSIHKSGELRIGYLNVPPTTPLPEEYARWLVHGYQACVSYTDAQIGRVLDELESQGLAENTIVILWGDHGWNLGEHTMWCKHCNYETSLRAPIIVKAPGIKGGKASDGLVEFIDIYPTLLDLAGLPVPEHCDGTSFKPLMKNPDQPGKKAVYSRWNEGETITTPRYQYTEWRETRDGEVTARMLYDHETDPDENINVAEQPEYAATVTTLASKLYKARQI